MYEGRWQEKSRLSERLQTRCSWVSSVYKNTPRRQLDMMNTLL